MRAVGELLRVLAAGIAGSLGLFAYIVVGLVVLTCGAAAAACMVGALFSLAMWLFQHDRASFGSMLNFLAWGCVPFCLIVLAAYYHGRLKDVLASRRARRAALGVTGVRLVRDADFSS